MNKAEGCYIFTIGLWGDEPLGFTLETTDLRPHLHIFGNVEERVSDTGLTLHFDDGSMLDAHEMPDGEHKGEIHGVSEPRE